VGRALYSTRDSLLQGVWAVVCDTHFADADSRSMLGPLDRLKRMLDAGVAHALPLAIVGLCQWHRHAYRRVDQSR